MTEITSARLFLLRRVQKDVYADEIDDLKKAGHVSKHSSLVKLSPFLNQEGLLCVGGRLENAPLPFDARHPIILPTKSTLTKAIIWKAHQETAHLSTDHTFHQVRRQYWVPKGRAAVKRVVSQCFLCRKMNPKPLKTLMAPLPAFRLQPGLPAFARTGVDYFGPIETKVLRSTVKRWGCLFTCLSSRAVHLEMAYSLESDSFIACLSRFELRRGTPLSYHSDNGTNFVGAHNELAEGLKRLNQEKIESHLARREVKWFLTLQ